MSNRLTRREKYAETQKLLKADSEAMNKSNHTLALKKRILHAFATEYLFVIGTLFLVCTWIIQTFPVSNIDKALKYLDIQFANWTNITNHQQIMQAHIMEFRLNSTKYSELKAIDGDSLFLSHEMSNDLSYCTGAMLQLENMYLYRYGEDSLESVMRRKKIQMDSLHVITTDVDANKGIVNYYAEVAMGLNKLTNSINNEIETLHESFIYEGNRRTKNLEKGKDRWEKTALVTLVIGTVLININLIKKTLKQQTNSQTI